MEKLRLFVPSPPDDSLVTSDADITERFVDHNADRKDIEFVAVRARADIVILFEAFSFKTAQYVNELTASPLVRELGDRLYCVNYDDIGRGFLPGCYTSLHTLNFDRARHRACAYPKVYNNQIAPRAVTDAARPNLLFSFRGRLQSNPVRQRLVAAQTKWNGTGVRWKVTEVNQPFHSHTEEQKSDYVRELFDSAFILCPRGWSPSTYRLFEAMQACRCPVILSDAWVPNDGVPWDECSVRISERDVESIPSILQARSSEAEALGRRAREVWENHFSEKIKYRGYLDAILELERFGPRENCRALLQRWRSWEFRWSNGWTLPQRVSRRARRIISTVSAEVD